MTKSQLIDRISEKTPRVPKRDIEAIVHTVFQSMLDALQREQRIEIRGFGSFAVKVREARDGRNPKTGQKVHVPRRRIPYFTVGKELRDRLNPQRPSNATTGAAHYGSSSLESSPAAQSFTAASEVGPRYPIR
ncbi:MAG TPA: integration host factor subunit beta [Myxococcaceae bacterium]|nr:integration host factor subunit beta [Myxococcaceae bacterium]